MPRYLSLIVVASMLVSAGCAEKSAVDPQKQRAFATELLTRQLYVDAIREFERYLELPGVSDKDRAEAIRTIGDALFDKASDYHSALIYYLRLRSFYPEYPQMNDIQMRIATCFERTGRTTEALIARRETAGGKAAPADSASGPIVAEFGNRKITERDVLRELEQLPPELRQQFGTMDRKKELLRQVVGRDILYEMAVERGYADSPQVQRQLDQMRRDMLVQRIGEEQLGALPDITEAEVQQFYREHRAELPRLPGGGVPSLQQIRPQVEAATRQAKQQGAFEQLIDRLFETKEVKLYPERMQ